MHPISLRVLLAEQNFICRIENSYHRFGGFIFNPRRHFSSFVVLNITLVGLLLSIIIFGGDLARVKDFKIGYVPCYKESDY